MLIKKKYLYTILSVLMSLALAACESEEVTETNNSVEFLFPPPLDANLYFPADKNIVELGRFLFFDPILSGNMDVSCATCHDPEHGLGDAQALSAGTGLFQSTSGMRWPKPHRPRVPRNAPGLLNLVHSESHSLFWDGRVRYKVQGGRRELLSSLGTDTPKFAKFEISQSIRILSIQSVMPLISITEMLGRADDLTTAGNQNMPASSSKPKEIWSALVNRLLLIPEYKLLFEGAFGSPGISIERMAIALAVFQAFEFYDPNTLWDRYLRKEANLKSDQLAGAQLFFGKAKCVMCHSGTLFTDQSFHNLAVPLYGPGKARKSTDEGRYGVSNSSEDKFKFKTPSLRNVSNTAPYMHNGAFATLPEALLHHVEPLSSVSNYQGSHLPQDVRGNIRTRFKAIRASLSKNLSKEIKNIPDLSRHEIKLLELFLETLSTNKQFLVEKKPDRVPSGLTVQNNFYRAQK